MNGRALLPLLALLALPHSAPSEITVNGISDETSRDNRATFTIPSEAGFTIEAVLDGTPVALDTPVEITEAGYYELSVTKTNDSDLSEESELIKFIVIDRSRGSSERGLRTWTPYPTIDSAPEAFANTRLEVVAPAALPLGFEIPVITRLRDTTTGEGVRLNGTIEIPELPGTSMRLLRGFGSQLIPSPEISTQIDLNPVIGNLTTPISVQVEPTTTWTTVSSDVTNSTDWGSNARIHVTQNFTVATGATLTIGPGTIVQLDPGVDLEIEGALQIDGTVTEPAFFTNVPGETPWGGIFLRQETAVVNATGTIFTGSGADQDWFNGSGYSHHRDEQATILMDTSETCFFTDCFFIDLQGQALHGNNASINVNDCLFQRLPTVGQFNGGSVTVTSSALLEFPDVSDNFSDDDNDGIYFTAGSHSLIETVIGWARDDGVDAGSGNSGNVTVSGGWFEACFHEGMAWSGQGRTINVSETVAFNSGQGIEAGWSGSATNGSPVVTVVDSLCIGNHIGWRFGDNYDWDYDGELNISDSISLYNDRNVWGLEWDSWTYRIDKMTVENNHLSELDNRHPNNAVWNGATDASLLTPFAPVVDSPVGCGLAEWNLQKSMNQYDAGVMVCLSEFSTLPATISYEIADGFSTILATGTIQFEPGEIRKKITLPVLGNTPRDFVRVTLTGSSGSTITTKRNLFFLANSETSGPRALIPAGATWRFLDDGTDQGVTWREPGFDDTSWAEGAAQLGYGDGDETTEVSFGGDSFSKHATTYFRQTFNVADPGQIGNLLVRLVRDDGAIVYLNGTEAFRSNIDPGPIAFDTYTGNVAPGASENDFVEEIISPSGLVAGENTIAVEVHQANATSSDLSFDLELLAEEPADTFLFMVRSGGETNLLWRADDGDTLQSSPSLETGWTDLTNVVSPLIIKLDPVQPRHFYRISRQ